MSILSGFLFDNSELSLAAYANLSIGLTRSPENQDALRSSDSGGAGMSAKEAEEFAVHYPDIVAVQPNTGSGFSATVFRSEDGHLAIAIRGTEVGVEE